MGGRGLMEDKGYFTKVCLQTLSFANKFVCRLISVLTLPRVKSCSLPGSVERRGKIFTKGNSCPAFWPIKGGQRALSTFVTSSFFFF